VNDNADISTKRGLDLNHLTRPLPPPFIATMGRLHSNGKGISSSAIPYSRAPPAWLKTTPDQVVDQICKLAKKGATPSQIGVVLRDSHGVAQVKIVTGKGKREQMGLLGNKPPTNSSSSPRR
jgi:small subunit ribosomal protein S13e